jgi:hypothetical protein
MDLEEIKMARRFFQHVQWTEHFLIAALRTPVHLINRSLAFWLIKGLDHFDRGLFRAFPELGVG